MRHAGRSGESGQTCFGSLLAFLIIRTMKEKSNLSFLLRLINWLQDFFFFWLLLFSKLFVVPVWWSELYSFFSPRHNVSGSLPEQCFLKTPLPPSLSQSEGAVKTPHHLPLFYIINPQLTSVNLSWHCLLFVVFIEMPRPCIPVRQSTVMSSASPRGRIFQMVSRDKKRHTLNNMLQPTNYCSAGEPTTCLLVKDYWPVYIC